MHESPSCWKIWRVASLQNHHRALELPGHVETHTPESTHPTHEQITRTSLEAHQTLMTVNPDNVARFKDVTQFLAEDLKTLGKDA